jgi:hypothetical protein
MQADDASVRVWSPTRVGDAHGGHHEAAAVRHVDVQPACASPPHRNHHRWPARSPRATRCRARAPAAVAAHRRADLAERPGLKQDTQASPCPSTHTVNGPFDMRGGSEKDTGGQGEAGSRAPSSPRSWSPPPLAAPTNTPKISSRQWLNLNLHLRIPFTSRGSMQNCVRQRGTAPINNIRRLSNIH